MKISEQQATPIKQSQPLSRGKKLGFSLALIVLIVVILEGGARLGFVVMGTSWTARKAVFQEQRDVRQLYARSLGRYTTHSYLPYVFRATEFPEADAWGNRIYETPNADTEDPYTIFTIGGSTTAGSYPQSLHTYLSSNLPDTQIRVVNGGVPAWTTAESLINFALRGLEYDPDLIVIYHAFNDTFPSCAAPFQADYSHWRRRLPEFEPVIFDDFPTILDHSAFYVAVRELFTTAERTPVSVLGATTANPPNWKDCELNGRDTFRRNLISIIGIARAHEIEVMLVTQAHRIQNDNVREIRQVGAAREHNDIVREIAATYQTGFFDFDAFIEPRREELMHIDTVHFDREGYAVLAQAIGDQIIAEYFSE